MRGNRIARLVIALAVVAALLVGGSSAAFAKSKAKNIKFKSKIDGQTFYRLEKKNKAETPLLSYKVKNPYKSRYIKTSVQIIKTKGKQVADTIDFEDVVAPKGKWTLKSHYLILSNDNTPAGDYKLVVKAMECDKDGALIEDGKTFKSKPQYFTLKNLDAPKAPTVARDDEGKVILTIQPVDGATKYNVYRYKAKTRKYKKIASTTSTTYVDEKTKADQTYKYKVAAVREWTIEDSDKDNKDKKDKKKLTSPRSKKVKSKKIR